MLDIKARAQQIQKAYAERPIPEKVNILASGPVGSGKTLLATTCPGPVLVHSFDPGGTDTIAEFLGSGKMLADTRFELEDPKKPSVFALWYAEVTKLEKEGFFNSIGTYFVDSGTYWAEALMNKIMTEGTAKHPGSRAGQNPQIQDYGEQQTRARNVLREIVKFPCNVVFTLHTYTEKVVNDKGEIVSLTDEYAVSGKMKWKMPSLFGELYALVVQGSGDAARFQLQTKSTTQTQARTRMGRNIFKKYEPQDIKALLKKVGRPSEDKPSLT